MHGKLEPRKKWSTLLRQSINVEEICLMALTPVVDVITHLSLLLMLRQNKLECLFQTSLGRLENFENTFQEQAYFVGASMTKKNG